MADLDTSLEHRRELKQQAARSGTALPWHGEAVLGAPGDPAPADARLLRIEQKLDRLARQVSGLPTFDGVRTAMIVVAALAVGAGLAGGLLTHP